MEIFSLVAVEMGLLDPQLTISEPYSPTPFYASAVSFSEHSVLVAVYGLETFVETRWTRQLLR